MNVGNGSAGRKGNIRQNPTPSRNARACASVGMAWPSRRHLSRRSCSSSCSVIDDLIIRAVPVGSISNRRSCILRSAMKKLCVLFLIAILASSVFAQTHSQENAEFEVRKTLSEFIQAFDNLDWERFRASFADNGTVFYPREFPHRAEGRPEFEQTFRHVFEQIRAGRSKGPYMDLRPIDLKIQIAWEVAVGTFHLDDRPGFRNRRTIVLQKTASGWKIIHLHASEVAAAQKDR